MSASVGYLELIILRSFLLGENFQRDFISFRIEIAVGALGEAKLCINFVARVFGEPACAVERAIGFLSAGERKLDAALGFETLLR